MCFPSKKIKMINYVLYVGVKPQKSKYQKNKLQKSENTSPKKFEFFLNRWL